MICFRGLLKVERRPFGARVPPSSILDTKGGQNGIENRGRNLEGNKDNKIITGVARIVELVWVGGSAGPEVVQNV